MNKSLKTKWIKALRSGKYKQTKHKLRTHGGAMCCLGVLCDIQGAKWVGPQVSRFDDRIAYRIEGEIEYEDTPRRYIAGIRKRIRHTLMRMNDGWEMPKHSFSEIADYIEENL